MAAGILKCYDAYAFQDLPWQEYNLLYCFVADENQVDMVFADEDASFVGDTKEFCDRYVKFYWKDRTPKRPDQWVKAASGALVFDSQFDDSYNTFDEAYAEAKKMLNNAQKNRAVRKLYRVGQNPTKTAAEYALSHENLFGKKKAMTAAATEKACPEATQDIVVNLENRQNAIDNAGYGPMNPNLENDEFWQEKAEKWQTDAEEAKTMRCGNCAAFVITPRMKDCIAKGLSDAGEGSSAWSTIDAGELGYCDAFDFKCAAARTCNAWITGGPVTEEKE